MDNTSMASPTIVFVSGVLVMGYAVASLFFFKFWSRTRDRLFAFFAAAFLLLAAHRVALTAAVVAGRETTWYYVPRLLAFLLILVAILEKNRASRG